MKPSLKTIRRNSDNLRAHSFENYSKMMSRLFESYRHYEMLKPASDALRRRDWLDFYNAAGSLSSQKYDDATKHFVANQFALLIKKYPFPKGVLPFDTRKNAMTKFLRGENRGRRINRKFSFLFNHRSRDRFEEVSRSARRFILAVLGRTPYTRLYSDILPLCDFGPGASVGINGNATHYLRKISESCTVGRRAVHLAFGGIMRNHHIVSRFYPRREDGMVCYDYVEAFKAFIASCSLVDYNKVDFVPKTSETDRSIGVEPAWNGFVQKGVDSFMRKRLKVINIDLSDQEINQRFAREGSADWQSCDSFVTIDLENASNSVYTEVVRFLLPENWFTLLNQLRSPDGQLDGQLIHYELFVSMGNGFCFPLETLLFASICHAVGAGEPGVDFVVYGDDIIVRKPHAERLIQALRHYGFKTNERKTFLEGPFRESCGGDFFDGSDVRPFTLDYALDSVQNVFKFLNLTTTSERRKAFFSCVRDFWIDKIDPVNRLYRPLPGDCESAITSLGDEHLSCPYCVFHRGNASWGWWELTVEPIVDDRYVSVCENGDYLASAALRGAPPISFGIGKGKPQQVFRRLTRAKLVRKGYSSTSNWLPGNPVDA